jgi:hypothetical protein
MKILIESLYLELSPLLLIIVSFLLAELFIALLLINYSLFFVIIEIAIIIIVSAIVSFRILKELNHQTNLILNKNSLLAIFNKYKLNFNHQD